MPALATIVPVEQKHLVDVARIQRTFLNSKHMFCCIPLGVEEEEIKYQKMYSKYPLKQELAAVALVEDQVVGFIQLVKEGIPCDLHTCKHGEMHIESVAVDPASRGLGVGTKLLEWAEEMALENSCNFLSLGVIAGNPAIRLYERKGYVIQPQSCISSLFTIFVMCLCFGPLICPAGSSPYWSCFRGHDMKKDLKKAEE